MVVPQHHQNKHDNIDHMARSSHSGSAHAGNSSRGNHHRSNSRYSSSPDHSRSRSRSPWRPGKESVLEKRQYGDDHYSNSSSASRRNKTSGVNDSHPKSYRDRSRSPWRRPNPPPPIQGALKKAPPQAEGHQKQASTQNVASTSSGSLSTTRMPAPLVTKEEDKEISSRMENSKTLDQAEEPVTVAKVSDVETIEQRRKKREAIRAKYGSGVPLLQQALQHSVPTAAASPSQADSSLNSNPQTPPSTAYSPSTPHEPSLPASPAASSFASDDEVVNVRKPAVQKGMDGPSAADYDPTMDIYNNDGSLSSKPHDAANGVAAPEPPKVSKPVQEFDMFAENDDEFDMFAAEVPKSSKAGAQALDQDLLDDWDYDNGHYRIINNELLDGRYTVVHKIGIGTFATVVRALDNETGEDVAIKIARNNDTMLKAGMKEINFLESVNGQDEGDNKHIVRLLRNFHHKKHLCLVFENLNMDLRQTLNKYGRDKGINLTSLKVYARQMFQALAHLKNCSVLHADIKPDNILVNGKLNVLKVCDFGTAIHIEDQDLNTPSQYLASRFYRAPEIMLGIKPDYAIDMWSVGCTLFEMYTARILFDGSNNNFMLFEIQKCLGKVTKSLIKKAALSGKYFGHDFTFYTQKLDTFTGRLSNQPHLFRVEERVDLRTRVLKSSPPKMTPAESKEITDFVDLLEKCLKIDPALRSTPEEALKHPFLARHSNKSSITNQKPK